MNAADSPESGFMYRALELAERGLGHTRPNPAVGAVIVKDGRIVGEGWHKKAGGDHAEVAAIKDALRRINARRETGDVSRDSPPRPASNVSRPLNGSTIYVTLEPCSKPGRVGACTDAIIAAGISKVVYAIPDPNPKNRSKARRALAKVGIECECWSADCKAMDPRTGDEEALRRQECVRIAKKAVAPFAKHATTGLPYVSVKIAMSLDGKTCDDWGDAKWISCEASRRRTNRMRETVDAIMVGAETVRKDNPSLLARIHPNKDLVRVVISKSGRLPKNAQVFTDGKNPTLVFDDAKKALVELGRMGMTHVLCEGGLVLARSLADQGLVDEWITVLAPVVIGSRRIGKALRLKHGPFVDIPAPRLYDTIIHYGNNLPTALS